MKTLNKIMTAARSTCLISALLLSQSSQALEIEGVKFDDIAHVAGKELALNGAAIRYKLIFKVYGVALYVENNKTTAEELLAGSGPRRIQIVMLRDVQMEQFSESFMSGMRKNSSKEERTKAIGQLQAFGEDFAQINEVKKGDILTLDYVPGTGTVMQVNGKQIGAPLSGLIFNNMILKLWLGDSPPDTRLKQALLGKPPVTSINSH
ncbi:Chalcone isomerase-like [Collimonas sp. OK307]|uniref:chalcone isomerase family protein n=1 Tax=Collimonas sp. OK307 TaxID=1801620 RepID=UPI0008EB2E55|nr:chalcone isomerase family protein [Collimonas sp. OK307]SFI00388.1 Chalcone isomerase-like [Collimonas sp. OK307]